MILGERPTLDEAVSRAVLRIRADVNAARQRLNQAPVSYAGVPVEHRLGCQGPKPDPACDACAARAVSL